MTPPPTPTGLRIAGAIIRKMNHVLDLMGIKRGEHSARTTGLKISALEDIAAFVDFESGARTSRALLAIADEVNRVRAVEDFSQTHDDTHDCGELARAAACYALPEFARKFPTKTPAINYLWELWPWENTWWKPSPDDRKRELVKAAGLLVAEWDRLDRLEQKANGTPQPLDLYASEVIDVWAVTVPGSSGRIVFDTESAAQALAKEVKSESHGIQKKTMTRAEFEQLREFQGD